MGNRSKADKPLLYDFHLFSGLCPSFIYWLTFPTQKWVVSYKIKLILSSGNGYKWQEDLFVNSEANC